MSHRTAGKRDRKALWAGIGAAVVLMAAATVWLVFAARPLRPGGLPEAVQPTVEYPVATADSHAVSAPAGQPSAPRCRFAVISDVHLYDTSLGTGPALTQAMDNSGKLFVWTRDLLDSAIDAILKQNVDFVLASGDLTKDGERKSHELFASEMKRLTDRGVKVYVVPGNHDIWNPNAADCHGRTPVSTRGVSPADFAVIYKGCGYGDAIARDSGSLSYVAEPVHGVWLISMDSCRYYDNIKYHQQTTAGRLTQEEVTWLDGELKKARDEGKFAIVMIHHGVVEHWKGEGRIYADYLLQDYPKVDAMLESYGVKLVFTGHFHAQDIAEDQGREGRLYDVETGSLANYACPVRIFTLEGETLQYRTLLLADQMVPGQTFSGKSFAAFASGLLRDAIDKRETFLLGMRKLPSADQKTLGHALAEAYLAHFAGDENPALEHPVNPAGLSAEGRAALDSHLFILNGLWNDPSVAHDNNGTINLATGAQN